MDDGRIGPLLDLGYIHHDKPSYLLKMIWKLLKALVSGPFKRARWKKEAEIRAKKPHQGHCFVKAEDYGEVMKEQLKGLFP